MPNGIVTPTPPTPSGPIIPAGFTYGDRSDDSDAI